MRLEDVIAQQLGYSGYLHAPGYVQAAIDREMEHGRGLRLETSWQVES